MTGPSIASHPGSRLHVGRSLLTSSSEENHIVQFYEDDGFLAGVVADFLGAGLGNGESLIVIATEAHQQDFADALVARGFDVSAARRSGQLTLLEARDLLSRFMAGRMPDPVLFQRTVGPLLALALARQAHKRVRAYGEMVDLLWADGNPEGALALEALWNDIGEAYPYTLLCAYRMNSFGDAAQSLPFLDVCRAHTHVIPTERYAQLQDPDSRLREVSVLQQRAQLLETEVEQRRHMEEALREALRVREDFLAIAGHELKTPLTAIQLQVQSLAKSPSTSGGDTALRERLGKVSQQVGRLSQLIEELLDVSRLGAGRLELDWEEVDLVALVREAAERASEGTLALSGLRIQVRVDGPVRGHWDRLRTEQVVANLLANAAKYGRGQPIEVRVGVVEGRARLVVKDRGIGISPEDQARIFERFERAVPSRHFGGLGLGLWISRQIVEAHQGSLRVESEVGQGATFFVELPLRPAPAFPSH